MQACWYSNMRACSDVIDRKLAPHRAWGPDAVDPADDRISLAAEFSETHGNRDGKFSASGGI